MRNKYGKTWWGQRFLKSLSDIDYDSRLPRGMAYANRDAVLRIEWKGNQLIADVQGTRRKPYQVRILFPPFPEKAANAFITAIAEQPETVSRLLNKDMDPSILDIAKAKGLKVFPDKWSDLKMQCSCPDWAVPCKHIAAVIYKTSAEIDNHPFLIFGMHGFDLLGRLGEKGHDVAPEAAPIPTLKDLYRPAKVARSAEDVFPASYERKPLPIPQLSELTDAIVSLLQPQPVFHPGTSDFRREYALELRRLAGQAARLLAGRVASDAYLSRGQSADAPLGRQLEIRLVADPDNLPELLCGGKKMPFPVLLAHAFEWDAGELQKRHPSHGLLHTGLFLSLQLLSKGAVVPQVVALPSGAYRIRWVPALLHPEVRSIVEGLSEAIPKGFVCWQARDRAVTPPLQAAISFLSMLLDRLMGVMATPGMPARMPGFFFHGKIERFQAPGEVTIPTGIQHWLQRVHASEGPFRVQVLVSEAGRRRFALSLLWEDMRQPMDPPIAATDLFEQKRYASVRYALLQPVSQLRGFVPGLDDYLREKGRVPAALSMEDLPDFLLRMVPAMQLMGVRVLLPRSLQQLHRPVLSMRIRSNPGDTSYFRLKDMLDFDWQVAVGDEMLGEKEFLKLLEKASGLIRLKSGFMYASAEDIEQLRRQLQKPTRPTAAELLTTALAGRYGDAPVELSREVGSMLTTLANCPEAALPRGLRATVRPYQKRGFSWLWRNAAIGFGSILADDMGLGKTLQVIATILKFKEEGLLEREKVLVVAPTGLLTNWQAECEKFAPSLEVLLYHGSQRELPRKRRPDVLITSYGVLRSDAEKLKKSAWRLMVIDEAQNIKNTGTAQTKAVKSVKAENYIAMSGTPVENRLTELWSIMDFANRGLLGTVGHFSERFGRPIQQFADPEAAGRLRKVCAPFLMRRMKTDKSIISDLPDKIEADAYARLTPPQAALYQKTLDSAMQGILQIRGSDPKDLFTRQGLVLQMILALKQVCNHPAQFLKNGKTDPGLSGKAELLFDRLDGIMDAGEKALVFSQFTEMGGLLSGFIRQRYGREPLFYHGGMTLKARKEMVERFQDDPSESVIILSLKAGGTGLNLTAASHVIHYDLWWNPAVEAQATDRAYRIGQRRDVLVHRFITKDTFEERINEMLRQKRALADLSVGSGEQWIGQLSNEQIQEIFRLG